MKFAEFGLDDKITRSIDQLGYKRPTDIQFKAIPAILEREDVLAIRPKRVLVNRPLSLYPFYNFFLKSERIAMPAFAAL